MYAYTMKMGKKFFEEGKRVKSEEGKNPEKKAQDENQHSRRTRQSSSGTQSDKPEGDSTNSRRVAHEFYYLL